jgi:predicted RND superfamily exporter protein
VKIASLLLAPIKLSEQILERLLFERRVPVLFVFAAVTLWLLSQAVQIRPDASFVKMIPSSHPYVENYLTYRDDLSGLGNSLRVVVQAEQGDIFTAEFQNTLKQVTDEAFYIPGVDRSAVIEK